jgi:hypothetical protein
MAKRTSRRSSSTTVSVSQATSSRAEFNPDYSIVKRDLQRIGLLAGIFTVALIILSFIIP